MHSHLYDLLVESIQLGRVKAVVDIADRVAEAFHDLLFAGLVLKLSLGILVIHQGLEWGLVVLPLLFIVGIFGTESKQDFFL